MKTSEKNHESRPSTRRLFPLKPGKPAKGIRMSVLAMLLLAGFLPQARAQFTLVLSNKWNLAPGSRYYLPTGGGNPRGMAINRTTGNVLVPSLVNSNHVEVVSGVDGSDLGGITGTNAIAGTNIVTGGNAALDGIAVADDGVIYSGNLDAGGSAFKIYRWSSEDTSGATLPTVAFGPAAPGGTATRCGDAFNVRGAGTNTQIIASGTGSGFFTIFTTTDGTNFTPNQIAVPATPGSGGFNRTVAFDGTNNAFWGGAANSTKIYYVTLNLSTLTATTVSNLTLATAMGMCDVDSTNGVNILAGISDNGSVVSASRNLLVYDLSNLSGVAQGGSVAFPAGGTADANVTGQADIGAGMVAALSTQGGIVALTISLQANTPPSITTPPVGVSGVFPAYTLSVGASGTQLLHYQWLASNAGTNTASTFTNIPGAAATTYAITAPTTNYFEVIVTNAFGSKTSTPVLVSLLTPVTSTVVTQLWRIPAGANGYTYLSPTDNNTRGIGYDANSNRVVVSSISGGAAIYVLDGNTGTNLGKLDLTSANLGGGTFQLDQVVVADDGAVYSGNLALPGQSFNLNRWPSPTTNATANNAYSDAGMLATSGDRWGDTMAVRGAGASTQILLGSRGGTNVALLTTADGVSFSASVMAISNVTPGFAANGIAFGDGNTLWGKAFLGDLFKVAFDPVALTGGKVLDFANPSQTPSQMSGVGVDPVHSILAGIDLADTPNDLKLFQVPGTTDPPVLFDQAFFASANVNGNDNVALAVKFPRMYGLDVNNGIVALTYGVPPTAPPTINTPPASQTVYTNSPAVTLSVGASGSLPLYYQWRGYGNSLANTPVNILNATNSTYVLNYPPVTASGYYDVIVHNIAGNATSTPPALLTVITPVSSTVVTQLWTLPAGSRSYLDGSSYNTRGLAYDTNTGTLLVADHFNIYLLSPTNGTDLGQLNTVGLPISGVNGWAVDQLGVGDDGVLYVANLSLDGTGFSIVSWPAISPGASAANYAWGPNTGTGADPSGTGDRWGDTMAVRGAGVSTEILCGSAGGTVVVLFTTTDGTTFSARVINVTNAPAGFAGQGIAFGPGNTFWAKSPGFNLRQVAFDTSTTPGTGNVVQVYTAGTQINSSMDGIDVDVANNILGGVVFSDVPNDLQLLLLSGSTNSPALFDQAFFGSVNANSQLNAATTLKAGHGFALDVNNGIVALTYGLPSAPPVIITTVTPQPGIGTALTWNNCFNGHGYDVQYKNALTNATWTTAGSVTAIGPTASFTDTSATGAGTRFYRIHSR
ncbi:MAG TPA: immunoglobulin domain-containing protein [Candidatus Binatia bacterium]|nr:immunoglobulin domain-containing protein [Candidatus Binatia bacterium]